MENKLFTIFIITVFSALTISFLGQIAEIVDGLSFLEWVKLIRRVLAR